jgi:hypothetical protein
LDLKSAANALGGTVSGDVIRCPGPGHSRHDDSLIVFLDGDSVGVHSWAGDDWKECKDYVHDKLDGLFPNKPQPHRPILPSDHNLHRAKHLWSCRKPAKGTIVENYIRARGCSYLPATIGYLEPGAFKFPAMIAAYGAQDEPEPGVISVTDVRGVHLTFLDGDGKADIPSPKITLGPRCSFPIAIAHPNDLLGLAITEGIEDAISVYEGTGLGAWAAGAAGYMPALATRVPGYIESITIFADADSAGEKGAYLLADALDNLGIEVLIKGIR